MRMPGNNLEIEAKYYVTDLGRIRMRLQELKALLIQPRVLETNLRFDLPDGRLRSEGRVLRLRQDTQAQLTYKDAGKNSQGILSRREIEFKVGSFENAKQLLEALGYQKTIYYEKYRTTYELDDCHVMLDELPFGNFTEIEGETVETIYALSMKLDLDRSTTLATSYSTLFDRTRESLKLSFQDISFANFTGIKVTASDLGVDPADKKTS